MDADLNALEDKAAQVADLCERLRAENRELRQQLAQAQSDARRLTEKIEGAKSKVEHLISRLPD